MLKQLKQTYIWDFRETIFLHNWMAEENLLQQNVMLTKKFKNCINTCIRTFTGNAKNDTAPPVEDRFCS